MRCMSDRKCLQRSPFVVGEMQRSALGLWQGRPVDLIGLAMVSQAAKKGLGQLFIAEQRSVLASGICGPWARARVNG
jgi:hypothetical protein